MECDILMEISRDKYPKVLDTLKTDWPDSIHIYYYIQNFINWTEKTNAFEFKIYCPRGNVIGEVVVGVLYAKENGYRTIMLHCVKESFLVKLKEALRQTSVIDWTQKVDLEASHQRLIPVLQDVADEKNLEYNKIGYDQVWLPPTKSKNISLVDLPLPEEFELRDLEPHHSGIINKTWAYCGPGTEVFVRNTIELNYGIGLFLKGNDNPVAWNTVQHFLGLGMLYTIDEYRNKGFASIVTKALSKKLADSGIHPYACIKYDNVPSLSMFKKLGFEKICMVYWGNISPKSIIKQ